MQDPQQQQRMAEELMQELRSKATELLLREQWHESIQVYTHFINICKTQISNTNPLQHPDYQYKLQKSLCLALCNLAEARSKQRDFTEALKDCDQALRVESTHFKTLLCKGKILLGLNMYSLALECFKAAMLDPQASENCENVNEYFEKCRKLESLSKTGAFDVSDWIVNGFKGKCFPELAEYIGAVQVRRSELSGRGLFATKNIDAGSLVLVTKAVAIERGILCGEDSGESSQLIMWKNFIDKVVESTSKCRRTCYLIGLLSTGEDEDRLEVPDISVFRPESEEEDSVNDNKLDMTKLLCVLDVNSLVEDAVSAKVLGKNSDYYGVGLWVLPSFINHSCNPNVRRLHVGDYLMVHACRDIKAGEELTFEYFDALLPLEKRKAMSESWGFQCSCKRCKFEGTISSRPDLREIEIGVERGIDVGNAVYRLEECIKRLAVRGKEKGYIRASFWSAYCEAYNSEKAVKRWGRKIPPLETVVDSVVGSVGIDERVLKMLVGKLKRNGVGAMEMEKAMKMARGVYGKVVKRQAMRTLLELGLTQQSY